MSDKQSPAFQFYPNDFIGSGQVGTMTTEEVGMYVLLLCLDWNETGFAYDEKKLARWCRVSMAKFRRDWGAVSVCFVERDGRLYNPRLEAERIKQAEWREKSSKGGKASGKSRGKGGSTVVQPPYEPNTQPNTNTPSPTPSPVKDIGDAESVVLAHYQAKHPRRKVGKKEQAVVRLALKTYSAADLMAAIDGNADDAWHAERHKHELTYVLRDSGKIDTFAEKARAAANMDRRIVDDFGCLTEYGERITRPALKVAS